MRHVILRIRVSLSGSFGEPFQRQLVILLNFPGHPCNNKPGCVGLLPIPARRICEIVFLLQCHLVDCLSLRWHMMPQGPLVTSALLVLLPCESTSSPRPD